MTRSYSSLQSTYGRDQDRFSDHNLSHIHQIAKENTSYTYSCNQYCICKCLNYVQEKNIVIRFLKITYLICFTLGQV